MGTGAVTLGTKAVELFNEYNTDKTNAKMAELLAAGFAINAAYDLLIKGKKFSGVTNGLASAGLYKARVGFQHRTFDEENATYHAHNQSLQKSIGELTKIAKDVGNLTEEQRLKLGEQVQDYKATLEQCKDDIQKNQGKLALLNSELEERNEELKKRIALLSSDLVKKADAVVEITGLIELSLKNANVKGADLVSIQTNVSVLTAAIKEIDGQLKAAANFGEAKK